VQSRLHRSSSIRPHLLFYRRRADRNDYSNPGKLVTLPTRVFAALASPAALALNYEFDDGPAKTVYSYEQMTFDFAGNRVAWVAGVADGSATSVYTLETRDDELSLKNEEVDRAGVKTFRNEYKLRRVGAP